jgi:hypothetical protein
MQSTKKARICVEPGCLLETEPFSNYCVKHRRVSGFTAGDGTAVLKSRLRIKDKLLNLPTETFTGGRLTGTRKGISGLGRGVSLGRLRAKR